MEPPVYAQVPGSDQPAEPRRASGGSYQYTNVEVKAGSLILMHGNLMHASAANRSDRSRIAFNFGVLEGSLPWLAGSYLQPYDGETEFEKLEPKLKR